jgi:hypothetical protein
LLFIIASWDLKKALHAGKKADTTTANERAELKRKIDGEDNETDRRKEHKNDTRNTTSITRRKVFSLLSFPPIPLRYNTGEASGPTALVLEGPLSQFSMSSFNIAF